MQKLTFHFSIFTFLLLLTFHSSAQEIISDLKYNTALIFEKHHSKYRSVDTLQLPFVDDFSYSLLDPNHKYPDQNLWLDKDCFVNTTYPVLPPTIGVATFDGLNEYGIPYDTSGVVQQSGADTLTSKFINLQNIAVTDTTVYFSFFYEKKGLGDFTNTGDKLFLELKKEDGSWNEVWFMDGDANPPTVIKFNQVMIHIVDTTYFFNNFQFRFRNIATTAGNNDHWHVDYVRLNSGRNYNDTLLQDVAAVYTPGTILKNYEFMPWTQFRNNQSGELSPNFDFVVHNNSMTIFNTNFTVVAREYYSPFVNDTMFESNPSLNLGAGAFSTQLVTTENDTASINGDSALLVVMCKANATPDMNRSNDSAYRIQPFYNYYSHDDGSAEKAYGLNIAGGRTAVKYTLNIPDTLRAIQFHFAHIDADISDKFFSIMVWKSLAPNEQLLYEQDFLHPTYIDSINGFATYILDTPKAITDTFYIGMLQSYPNYYYVGLDRNTDSHLNSYYNVGNGWQQSSYAGSLMIRPIVGARLPYTSAPAISANSISVNCYPNPTADFLHVNVKGITHAELFITDLMGRTIQTAEETDENIFVGNLSQGMYLITVKDKLSKQSFTTRFIKL